MRKKLRILTIPFMIVLAVAPRISAAEPVSESSRQTFKLGEKLPVDPNVTVGRLKNNLNYYVRENRKPEKRMELRLVVKAGSVLEEDTQQGLAHFIEHMAFNGTKNFKKHDLVDYLESIGMRFGPELNAYTGFDETVYMLQVPTDSVHITEKAFQILEDWAHGISFDSDEVERERGVILEEWRQGRGAEARMRDKQLPILFKGSQYADRLPIGKVDEIKQFTVDDFRRFYGDWYRPDLMAVIAVGDFDRVWIEKQIREHFSGLKGPKKTRKRIIYPLPDNDETLFAIATDPEASRNSASIYYKLDVKPEKTVSDYRLKLVEKLYNSMFNQRLLELSRESDPPFLYGYSAKTSFILSKDMYVLGTGVVDNGITRGLEALLTESGRVGRFGFTSTELDRQKKEMLRMIEQYFVEREKTESDTYADEYVRNFLNGEPFPGIAAEHALFTQYVPGIALDEVNKLAAEWISDRNRVIMINAPEKPGVVVPDEAAVLTVMKDTQKKELQPYKDTVSEKPLVETPPTPSPVVGEREIAEIGVSEWTLRNGVRVVLKPTDFKNDEILFTATSPGGNSLVPDEQFTAVRTAATIVSQGGVGEFNLIALEKLLSGKVVNVTPWIGSLDEGLSGNVSPKDIETMFQLICLYFTAPREDSTAFLSFRTRMKGMIENRSSRPETALSDTIAVTMAQYHYRARPWTLPMLDEMDLASSFAIYQDRFRDASDFTFFFVGTFTPSDIRPLVETYLGGLPSIQREESWRDTQVRYPKGVIEKEVRAGIEPKSRVTLLFTGDFSWTYQNRYTLGAMVDILRIKLRETIREDMGGTYGVGVSQSVSHYPDEDYQIAISFGCAPERVGELTAQVFSQLDSLKSYGTTETYLAKVKEMHKRQRETDLKENSFWLNVLEFYYENGEDPLTILEFDERVEKLSLADIQAAARQYLDMNNVVNIVLYPEKK